MKLIGITGSCGKTSVAEIVYQYLICCGYSTSLYSSNGLFVNGLTKEKDYLQTTLYHKALKDNLEDDEKSGVQYAVIEITAESIARRDKVHLFPFEVVALTSFFDNLYNHFNNKVHYYECKRTILESSNAKKVLLRLEERNYLMFNDIPHEIYGYSPNSNYQLIVLDNNINGLKLSFNNTIFETNLITAYHARNIACALAILSSIDILDMEKFKDFAKKIFIRGRFEKIQYKGKNIILDTGNAGADILLLGMEKTLGNDNYKIIYTNKGHKNINNWVLRARKNAGNYLKRSKFIYLVNPDNKNNIEEDFVNNVICDNTYKQYKYISNINDVCIEAINNLQENETLIIFTRENYRLYRNYIENL